jgi:hypothetical protein
MEKFNEIFNQFKAKLQTLAGSTTPKISEDEAKTLARYRELKIEAGNLQLLGESEAAEKLTPEILGLQDKVKRIEARLKVQPSGRDNVLAAASKTTASELHKLALAVQSTGIDLTEATVGELEKIRNERLQAKARYLELVEQEGNLYRQLYDIYPKVRQAEKALPESRIALPLRAPEWSEYDISDEAARRYGNRPSRAFISNI